MGRERTGGIIRRLAVALLVANHNDDGRMCCIFSLCALSTFFGGGLAIDGSALSDILIFVSLA